jgi:hypothetical protein
MTAASTTTAPTLTQAGSARVNRIRSPSSAGTAAFLTAWNGVRSSHGDTKTEKSRRTLALPDMTVNVIWAHQERQATERLATGGQWSEHDLVFSTRTGGALDAAESGAPHWPS